VKCEPVELDPTGALKCGQLRLVGQVINAKFKQRLNSRNFHLQHKSKWETVISLDCDSAADLVKTSVNDRDVQWPLVSAINHRQFFLILVPTANIAEYKRIGLGYTGINLQNPNSELWDFMSMIERTYGSELSKKGSWFKDVEPREITPV
jgi:hypothetical protein